MRRGVGAELLHQQGRGGAQVAQRPIAQSAHSAHIETNQAANAPAANADGHQARANIARLLFDLRNAMRLTPHQAAAHIQTTVETIQALETGHFEYLPAWPETSRVVMAYAAMAGIDGRAVLAALASVISQPVAAPVAPHHAVHAGHHAQVDRLRQAGTAFANGAKRLPAGAMKQVRERPERAFYAVSLPLAIVLLLLNTSVLQAAFDHVPRPVSRMSQTVRQFFQEQFAPVREGLRWIEVDEPRRRRADKLRPGG